MTNAKSGGKRRNPLDMAGPCAELWAFAEKLAKGSSFLFEEAYTSPFSGAPEVDSWLEALKEETVAGFTTGGAAKRDCRVWERLSRLIHTDTAEAPTAIATDVSKAHGSGVLISLDRNAALFLPRREYNGAVIEGGTYCLANQTDEMRAKCEGMDAVNDCAESSFALFDFIARRCNGLTIQAASAVTQMIMNNDVGQAGKFSGRDESKSDDANTGRRRKDHAQLGWFHLQDSRLQAAIFRTISHDGDYFLAQNKQDEDAQLRRAAERVEDSHRLHIKQTALRYVAAKKAMLVTRAKTVAEVEKKLRELKSSKRGKGGGAW